MPGARLPVHIQDALHKIVGVRVPNATAQHVLGLDALVLRHAPVEDSLLSPKTCGSDPRPYNAAISLNAFQGETITVAVPTMYPPSHFKTNAAGQVCAWGDRLLTVVQAPVGRNDGWKAGNQGEGVALVNGLVQLLPQRRLANTSSWKSHWRSRSSDATESFRRAANTK